MSYPRFYRVIREMIPRVILELPFARKMARRADIRMAGESGPRTVVEGFIHPEEDSRARIWYVDFSSVAYVRLFAQSSATVYLNRLESGSSIDGTPSQIYGRDAVGNLWPVSADRIATDLGWLRLEDDALGESRVGIGMAENRINLDPATLDGPFSLVLQAE
jgi:hypothetical protein